MHHHPRTIRPVYSPHLTSDNSNPIVPPTEEVPMTLTVPPTILMHTTLAFLSPEVQTLQSILSSKGMKFRLPAELLLLIRHHLLPVITASFLEQSEQALVQYESSLRDLLCSDCIVYNHDIYGPDIWEWEHFSGPCRCTGFGPPRTDNVDDPQKAGQVAAAQPQPQRFIDRLHWLESYLSYESTRFTGHPLPLHNPSLAIWAAVQEVLAEHNCRILRGVTGSVSDTAFLGVETLIYRRNAITIIPVPSRSSGDGGSSVLPVCGDLFLNRAKRDLGLDFEYEERLDNQNISIPRTRSRILQKVTINRPTIYGFALHAQFATICVNGIHTIVALVVACLSLPLTSATLALTVLCYYSRPRSFRIL